MPAIESHSQQSRERKQFLLFLLVSGVAAAANLLSRVAFNLWMPYTASIMAAFCIGLTVAFLLNRLLVFSSAANAVHEQAFWFIVINAIAALQTLVVSLVFLRFVLPSIGVDWHDETIAHAVGVATPVFTSYIGHKRLTFRGPAAR